jgi:hypothetical protein
LRADLPHIRSVIDHYNLADIFTQYLISQYKKSPTLSALGLQFSQAFTVNAFDPHTERDDLIESNAACNTQQGLSARENSACGHSQSGSSLCSLVSLRNRSGQGSEEKLHRCQTLDVQPSADSTLQRQGFVGEHVPLLGSPSNRRARGLLDTHQCLRNFGARTILLHLMHVCFSILPRVLLHGFLVRVSTSQPLFVGAACSAAVQPLRASHQRLAGQAAVPAQLWSAHALCCSSCACVALTCIAFLSGSVHPQQLFVLCSG